MRDETIRRACVCASEMPAIVGLDPYGNTPLTVYLRKMGLVEPEPETPAMRWGRLIEQACLQAYQEDKCHHTDINTETTRHQTYPFLAGTPDALVFCSDHPGLGGVEIKTVGFHYAHHWIDGVPDYVRVQCAIYMSIFDVPTWDVGRLILATRDWKIETLQRDPVLEEILIDAARDFYQHRMVERVVPPLDGSQEAQRYLQRTYPTHSDQVLEARLYPWVMPAVQEWFTARKARRLEQQLIDINAAVIKECIGDRLGIRGEDWMITWKSDKKGTRRFVAIRKGDDDAAGQ